MTAITIRTITVTDTITDRDNGWTRKNRALGLKQSHARFFKNSGDEKLHNHAQPSGGPRDAGIEPARAAVLEGEAFVEQHDVVPLRTLGLVHGQHVAVIELVIGLALLPR